MEIDLHGYTILEAMEIFIKTYNTAAEKKEQFKVIHGYGAGGHTSKIKLYLHRFLEDKAEYCEYFSGEKIDGNPGYIIVKTKKRMPDLKEIVGMEICDFCINGKSTDKIVGNFRKYGEPKINEVLKKLENSGMLKSYYKGKYKIYETVEE